MHTKCAENTAFSHSFLLRTPAFQNCIPAQLFRCQAPLWTTAANANTGNHTTQHHTIGPVMLIKWDPFHSKNLSSFVFSFVAFLVLIILSQTLFFASLCQNCHCDFLTKVVCSQSHTELFVFKIKKGGVGLLSYREGLAAVMETHCCCSPA